jgi:hypothetical protein
MESRTLTTAGNHEAHWAGRTVDEVRRAAGRGEETGGGGTP